MNRKFLALALAVNALMGASCRRDGEEPSERDRVRPPAGPRQGATLRGRCPIRVVGVIHSAGGRTRAAAEVLRAAFDADIRWIEDRAQSSGAPVELPDAATADLVIIGGPIWGLGPTPQLEATIERLALAGKPVVLLITYLHGFDPKRIDSLTVAIQARGGLLIDRVVERFPAEAAGAAIQDRLRRVLSERGPKWVEACQERGAETITPACEAGPGGLCSVPAGSAWVGCLDPDACLPGMPAAVLVSVEAFRIGGAEVTLGEYQACVTAGACPSLEPSRLPPDLLAPDRPVLLPTSAAAADYCRWVERRLPTDAEWTRAGRAAGPTRFPWGTEVPQGQHAWANLGEAPATALPFFGTAPTGQGDGVAGLATPCSFQRGVSPFGVCDLVGNVAEWVRTPEGFAFVGGSWMESDARAVGLDSRGPPTDEAVPYVAGVRCATDGAR